MLDVPAGWSNRDPVSEQTQRRIDEAIQGIVTAGFDAAQAVLTAERAVLELGAQTLLQKETLDEAAIRDLRAQMRQP
jgi:cell division protease FtsH